MTPRQQAHSEEMRRHGRWIESDKWKTAFQGEFDEHLGIRRFGDGAFAEEVASMEWVRRSLAGKRSKTGRNREIRRSEE